MRLGLYLLAAVCALKHTSHIDRAYTLKIYTELCRKETEMSTTEMSAKFSMPNTENVNERRASRSVTSIN